MNMMSSASQSSPKKRKNKKKLNLNKMVNNLNRIKKITYKRKSKLYSISLKKSELKEKRCRMSSLRSLSHLLKSRH